MVVNPVPSIMPKGAAEGRTLSGIRGSGNWEIFWDIHISIWDLHFWSNVYVWIDQNMHMCRRRTVYRCNDHIDVQVRKIYDTRGRCKYMHNIPTDVNRFSLQVNIYICIHVYIHTLHDMISLSHSYTFQGKHQQIHFPTQPKPRNNENHITYASTAHSNSDVLNCHLKGRLTKPPCLAGAATAWCVPFVTCVTVGRRSDDRR